MKATVAAALSTQPSSGSLDKGISTINALASSPSQEKEGKEQEEEEEDDDSAAENDETALMELDDSLNAVVDLRHDGGSWEKPHLHEGLTFAASQRFAHSRGRFVRWGPCSRWRRCGNPRPGVDDSIEALGPGMVLYFKFIVSQACVHSRTIESPRSHCVFRQCSLTLVVTAMAVVALPAITMNLDGNGIPSEDADPLGLSFTMLGNIGRPHDVWECTNTTVVDATSSDFQAVSIDSSGQVTCHTQAVAKPLLARRWRLTVTVLLQVVVASSAAKVSARVVTNERECWGSDNITHGVNYTVRYRGDTISLVEAGEDIAWGDAISMAVFLVYCAWFYKQVCCAGKFA